MSKKLVEILRFYNPLIGISQICLMIAELPLLASFISKYVQKQHYSNLNATVEYREYQLNQADIENIRTTKDDLRKSFSRYYVKPKFSWNPLRHISLKAATSGTSGMPLQFRRNLHDIFLEEAFQRNWRRKIGWKTRDKVAVLRGDLLSEFSDNNVSYKTPMVPRLYLNTYSLTTATLVAYHKALLKFQPKVLYCYPTIAVSLAKMIKASSLEKISIPIVVFSSERLNSVDRLMIKEVFSANIYGWYGNGERTVAAAQCEFGTYHFVHNYATVVIASSGLILSTPLLFNTYKILNHVTDDYSDGTPFINCECQSKSIGVRDIIGRDDEYLYHLDGTRFTFLNTQLTRDEPTVIESQIYQFKNGDVEIRITPANQSRDTLERILNKSMERLPHLKISIVARESLERTDAGNLRPVISDFFTM